MNATDLIQKQQQAASDILKIAEANGLIVTVWTVEDVIEKIENAATGRDVVIGDKEMLADIACGLMDAHDDSISEQSIAVGSNALQWAASMLVDQIIEDRKEK